LYDYKGSADLFAKITAFKKTTVRIAETSLSVEHSSRIWNGPS